jgi:DNA-directed RNA polymerase subunit K/omega
MERKAFLKAEMEKRKPLTNESIKSKFKSQFELVNYAIKLAEQMIHSGRAPQVSIDNQNTAVIIIEEIEVGKDKMLDILPVSKEIIAEPQLANAVSSQDTSFPSKPKEKKKARRILA